MTFSACFSGERCDEPLATSFLHHVFQVGNPCPRFVLPFNANFLPALLIFHVADCHLLTSFFPQFALAIYCTHGYHSPQSRGKAMPLPTDLITPKEAAKLVRCSVATIYRWIHGGQIRAYKWGMARYRVSRAAVEGQVSEVVSVHIPQPSQAARETQEAMAELKKMGMG